MNNLFIRIAGITAIGTGLVLALSVSANHSWGGYHWARTSNPFTVKLGDNLTSAWKPYLSTTSKDWSASNVLDTAIVAGSSKSKNCRATSGRVEICNANYGFNGWLGVASIWASGSHITQGTVKLNDSYFSTSTYNTPAWKNLVMCQEVGHTFGLDHQDENSSNANLGTCMDYTNDPATNQHPNKHDYDMLDTIYAHFDSFSTVSQTTAAIAQQNSFENASEWGKSIKYDNQGRPVLFERDFGGGNKVFTFVVWAE
jgi:hypothetical protein